MWFVTAKSVQSQGTEKQPTKMWKNILQKHPAIISVGLVIILGEVNNASGLGKHTTISLKKKKAKLLENSLLREEVSLLKIMISKYIQQIS